MNIVPMNAYITELQIKPVFRPNKKKAIPGIDEKPGKVLKTSKNTDQIDVEGPIKEENEWKNK
ncbi:MAG: hypothetical protein MZV64_09215 [Ignavibacteriales bacterium]|nr:hypothetical protein [Ignavibacteriales bacterium]